MLSTMEGDPEVHPSTEAFVSYPVGVGYVTSSCYQSDWWNGTDRSPALEAFLPIVASDIQPAGIGTLLLSSGKILNAFMISI